MRWEKRTKRRRRNERRTMAGTVGVGDVVSVCLCVCVSVCFLQNKKLKERLKKITKAYKNIYGKRVF